MEPFQTISREVMSMRNEAVESSLSSERGFSLIELLVVGAVMTMVLAFSLPAFNKSRKTAKLMNATREVSSTMKLARSRAVATSNPVIVEFDDAAGTFQAFEDVDGDSTYDAGEVRVGPYELPNNVSFTDVGFANGRVTFRGSGAASESQSIVLLACTGHAQRVEVSAPTGIVYISEVYRYGEETARDGDL
jgi:prepilin-type N-terminal cleavage/methylation domain-containing protein